MGGYNNFRYFLNRLKEYDLELIEPEGGYKNTVGKTNQKNTYAKSCGAIQDLQPIVLYREELEEIDKITGQKQEGISYPVGGALPVHGRDIPGSKKERLYICPRFWDRKYNIPLIPEKLEHPILKIPYESKDGGEQWKDHVVPNDLTTQQLKIMIILFLKGEVNPKVKKKVNHIGIIKRYRLGKHW